MIVINQWNKAAFYYDVSHDYAGEPLVQISSMNQVCTHCGARKWKGETPGICCGAGKIKLRLFSEPPEPLKQLLMGNSPQSKHFLKNILQYNCAFQMTSLGAKVITEGNFMPTFKVQGQIYHRIGSLLPLPNKEPQFLQLYFISDMEEQARKRKDFTGTDLQIIKMLQEMLDKKNNYIQSFKFALESAPSPDFRVVIDADKRPTALFQEFL